MRGIDNERWVKAQEAERKYWEQTTNNKFEIMGNICRNISIVKFLYKMFPEFKSLQGPFVEIGIGPIGIGCLQFIERPDADLYGVDPLPQIEPEINSSLFKAMIDACRTKYTHIQCKGEKLELPSAKCDFAFCCNVLDHTENPEDVLKEINRILKSKSYLLLSCDVLSYLSLLRHRILRIYDAAHPYKFSSSALEDLVIHCGFKPISVNHRRFEFLDNFLGREFHRILLAQKD